MISKFDLFCMIFYALDASWNDSKDESIGEYLSGANPFLFDDIGSADNSTYLEFCDKVDAEITIENSYQIASKYLETLENVKLCNAFKETSEEEWKEGFTEYLSQNNK